MNCWRTLYHGGFVSDSIVPRLRSVWESTTAGLSELSPATLSAGKGHMKQILLRTDLLPVARRAGMTLHGKVVYYRYDLAHGLTPDRPVP